MCRESVSLNHDNLPFPITPSWQMRSSVNQIWSIVLPREFHSHPIPEVLCTMDTQLQLYAQHRDHLRYCTKTFNIKWRKKGLHWRTSVYMVGLWFHTFFISTYKYKLAITSSQLKVQNYYYTTAHNTAVIQLPLQVPHTSREFPSRSLNNIMTLLNHNWKNFD